MAFGLNGNMIKKVMRFTMKIVGAIGIDGNIMKKAKRFI